MGCNRRAHNTRYFPTLESEQTSMKSILRALSVYIRDLFSDLAFLFAASSVNNFQLTVDIFIVIFIVAVLLVLLTGHRRLRRLG
jgi:hypothetical protein